MRILMALLMAVALTGAADDFTPLFNGQNLDGWEEDTQGVWTVRDGMIVGAHNGLEHNDFLRTTKDYSDFVLRLEFRLVNGAGNSGIQFRSEPVPDSHEVSGYQADAGLQFWGSLYDESRRRQTLARPSEEFLQKLDAEAWHTYVITADGNHITLELDGVKTVDYTEEDPEISGSGLIAVQVHGGREPIEVHFRNIEIRELR